MNDLLYKKYVNEEFNEDGSLKRLSVNVPENFNFTYDVIDEVAAKTPDKCAIHWTNDSGAEKIISYKDLSDNTKRAARFFESIGLKKGDKVLLILKRHYQFWYILPALHRLGCIGVPATNQLMVKDICYRISKANISAVVCTTDGEIADFVDQAIESECSVKTKICAGGKRDGWISFDEELQKFPPEFNRPTDALATNKDDIMLMYFTSGTTGYPKVCMLPFAYPLGHIVTARYWQNVDPEGLHLTLAETGWAKAVWGKLYGQLLCESAIFVYDFERFAPVDVLNMIEQFRITTLCAPPTIFRFLIKEDMSKYDLSSLKYVTTAGEAINPEVFNKFYQNTGIKLMEAYGQTEATVLIGNFYKAPQVIEGSMGKPSPQYDIDLIDDEGQSVEPGVIGEICVRTDGTLPVGMFSGYYHDEDITNTAYKDNIYHTGDLAWRDENGFYYYVSRKDDVIKSSGYRIGPFEIESVLMEHPAVLECAVTGAPDETRGQVVKATIVTAEKYKNTDKAALAKEIQDYVKHATAPYKYPRIIDFVDSLPKTISGKIMRNKIK